MNLIMLGIVLESTSVKVIPGNDDDIELDEALRRCHDCIDASVIALI